ncbi:AraC family transcriptional regulator [Actinoallomurus iriomotensis]|uniref:AraC family transcriptional regulator n=1 Tax=Actinoallomurus iriomotensis TaxID=478107 RepID=A0A9W6VX13_9ACTN|nr:AraC family transcriptional regulator [Actinoallomurus iriomotensis]GLY81336.1 AraC family transcriptional regulator [Actinoallomurus iriomotensis]
MDVLSDVIAVMRTGRPSSSRLRLGARWCYRFAPYDGAGFHVFLRGAGWLLTEHADPTPIGPGDVVLVPHGGAHVLSDSPRAEHAVPFESAAADPDGPTDVLCGKYRLDRTRTHPVLARLPEVVHLPAQAGRHADLRAAIDLLGGEVSGRRPGRDAVVSGLLDLLLVYMVRAWLDDNAATGWPQALRDPTLAAALEALHADPARPWRLQDLAATAGLSRATLARRFTSVTGQSPMAYLAWWRMAVAARLLRDTDLSLPEIARRVGYGSPYAFAHAFKRHFGLAPGRYRTADQTVAATA